MSISATTDMVTYKLNLHCFPNNGSIHKLIPFVCNLYIYIYIYIYIYKNTISHTIMHLLRRPCALLFCVNKHFLESLFPACWLIPLYYKRNIAAHAINTILQEMYANTKMDPILACIIQ